MSVQERTVVLADTGAGPQRSGPGRGLLALAATVVAVVLAGLVVLVTGGGDSSGQQPAPQADTAGAGSATGTIGVSFPRTQAGATDAAVAYLAAFADPRMYEAGFRTDAVDAILDPVVAGQLADEIDTGFATVARRLGLDADGATPIGSLVTRTAPLGVDVVSFEPDRAVVAVWAVAVLGVAGDASPAPVQTSFGTDTVTLAWSGGTWRWNALAHVDGPVPAGSAQVPSPSAVLADAQQRFAPYGGTR